MTLGGKPLSWFIFGAMAIVTAFTGKEIVVLVFLAGLLSLFLHQFQAAKAGQVATLLPLIVPVALTPSIVPLEVKSTTIFLFFAKAGMFVFGSGLAIIPFLHGSVVDELRWLTERQFLDAVAVAMITPGPVVITVGFIGFLVGGFGGAVAAASGVFLPIWLVIVIVAPVYQRLRKSLAFVAFIQGVTAAAVGAIAGAVVVIGMRTVMDLPTAAICAITMLIVFRFKIPEPLIILEAGVLGVGIQYSV